MDPPDAERRQRAFVEAELKRAGVPFINTCTVRSQLAPKLHERTGTFWVTGERLREYQDFADPECALLERSRTRTFCELAREMGAFVPDTRPFHALRFVVDMILGRPGNRRKVKETRRKRAVPDSANRDLSNSQFPGQSGAEWAGLCAAFDAADPLVRSVISRLLARFPAVSAPSDIPGAFAALRAELADSSGILGPGVVEQVLALAERFRAPEDALESSARPGLSKIIGDVLHYPVNAPTAFTAALVEAAAQLERKKAERERAFREEALLAAQEEFFAAQLEKLGCTTRGPSGLLPLLRRVRDFHYQLDWTRICRRAAKAQESAQDQIPAALEEDTSSSFREQLTSALQSFSGLREFKPYHFLAALVGEIRTAVRAERVARSG